MLAGICDEEADCISKVCLINEHNKEVKEKKKDTSFDGLNILMFKLFFVSSHEEEFTSNAAHATGDLMPAKCSKRFQESFEYQNSVLYVCSDICFWRRNSINCFKS